MSLEMIYCTVPS